MDILKHKYVKIVITALLVAASIYSFVDGKIGNGIFILLLTAFPILLFFRNEFLLLAFWFMRKEDMVKAESFLDKINKPEDQLIKSQQGYFYYLKGLMLSRTNINKAETFIKKGLELGLNMQQDKAMAKMTLAGAAMSKGRKNEAITLLNEAKKLDAGMLTEQIKTMKDQMKRPQMSRSNMINPQMRNRGGKR